MPIVQDITTRQSLDGFVQNRREMYAEPAPEVFQGNRMEPIPPQIQKQIVDPFQQLPPASVPSQALNTVDTGNAGVTSEGDAATAIRFWAGSTFANRDTAVFRVDKSGNLFAGSATIIGSITATTGVIGGWTITATTLVGGDAVLDSAGVLTLGTGNNVVVLSAVDPLWRMWVGDATAALAPFRVDQAGNLFASSATLAGYLVDTTGTFAGDGSDGAVSGAAGVTLAGTNNTLIVRQYSSWAAGAQTLTVTPTGCIVLIKIQGNADFTNWTMTFTGKGNAGGAGGAAVTGVATNGNDGVDGTAVTVNTLGIQVISGGIKGLRGTAAQGTGGLGGTVVPRGIATLDFMQASHSIWAAVGAGGGGGASGATNNNTSGAGGAGGAGGGCVIFQIGGNVTFGTTTVNCNGAAGTAGGTGVTGAGDDGAGGGGGGGGGGGTFICLYNGTLTGAPTTSVAGGAGGAAGAAGFDTAGWDGGGGGGGGASIQADGTAGLDGTAPNGGAGSAGGAGLSLLALNTAFG